MPIEDDLRASLARAARLADEHLDGSRRLAEPPMPVVAQRHRRVPTLIVALAIGIAAVALAVVAFDRPDASRPAATPTSSDTPLDQWDYPDLRGQALAEALGLELQPFEGCDWFVGIRDQTGYCIEGMGTDEIDRAALAYKLQERYDDPGAEVFRSYADRTAWVHHDFAFGDDASGSIDAPPGWTVQGFGHGFIFDADEQPIVSLRSPSGRLAQSCLPVFGFDHEGTVDDSEGISLGDVAISIRWWSGGGWGGTSPPPAIQRPRTLDVDDARTDEWVRCGNAFARHLAFVVWDDERRVLIDVVTGSRSLVMGELAIVDTISLD
jgi:hypothetical protein